MNKEDLHIAVQVEDEEFLPFYASDLAAGADVKAKIAEELWILPGESALIPTGIRMALPPGYEVQVRPRSGLALKEQVTVLNAPGTIDADYRGEVGVILINHGKKPFLVKRGMRIAQIVVAPVLRGLFISQGELETTARGSGGFGHTGYGSI
ncbi:MAG: dUTP diphosphatase [Chlamydiae bacterium]|nr:dUTP diphosphatase [Chlamydiota bacterium]